MAADRVLIVHASESMRAHLSGLLSREGYRTEAVGSTFAAMLRYVEDRAALVLLGLGALDEAELDFVRTLKREADAPRVLVLFPSPKRDVAVRALDAGADGYALEPFYDDELANVVKGQLGLLGAAAPSAALPGLAREVAHAIRNPLQVMTLLLQKSRVTKKELTAGLPDPLTRIEAVVRLLQEYGAIRDAMPEALDPVPLARAAADDAGFGFEGGDVSAALADRRNTSSALTALCTAVAVRGGKGRVVLSETADAVEVRVETGAETFEGEALDELLDSVFVVRPDREVVPGLALPRALLEGEGGTLAVERRGRRITLAARLVSAAG